MFRIAVPRDMFEMDTESDNEDDQINFEKDDVIHALHQFRKSQGSIINLRKCVIASVVKNIDFWLSSIPQDAAQYMYMLSPFDSLSSIDTLEILKQLKDCAHPEKLYINLFLHQKLLKFDLSILKYARLAAVKILINRCRNLRELSIPSQPQIPINLLNDLTKKCFKLESLTIDRVHIGNDFIENLTKYCKNLKSLSLHASNIPYPLFNRLVDLKHLKKLTLKNANKLTKETLMDILMSTQLHSLCLSHSQIRFQAMKTVQTFNNIMDLDISFSSTVNDVALMKVIDIMPDIIVLSIASCTSLTTEGLSSALLKLKKIQKLNVAYSTIDNGVKFGENFELFLIRQGMQLVTLDISGVKKLKTKVIALCCANLTELKMLDIEEPKFEFITRNDIAQNNLLLSNIQSQQMIDRENLSLLDICYRMKKFSISCSLIENLRMIFPEDCLSLEELRFHIDKIITLNYFHSFAYGFNFPKLKVLDLSRNRNISAAIVYLFLYGNPNIEEFIVLFCDFTATEMEGFKRINDAMLSYKSPFSIVF